ncbi:MAG: alpha/beta hydrolase [Pseudorhodobacter sp.]|nr:alpha/beta hydrolase [Rhizobacter sp.]
MNSSPYLVQRHSRSHFITARGLRHHVLQWGEPDWVTATRPALVMLHGWMDVAASFQFVVDALPTDRYVLALDFRGFGLTDTPAADSYWFPDYLGDLEAVLDALLFDRAPEQQFDLLGHSMGGNVAMLYAGIRPERIRKLINLEGFGLPASVPAQAPKRYAQWLNELKAPLELRTYDNLEAVANRLRKTNPLLPENRALWLAQHWSRQTKNADGSLGAFEILGDAAHKRVNPVLSQVPEVLAVWKQITAPVLWVEGDQTDTSRWWGTRYTKAEFHERISVVNQVEKHTLSPAGHMLHHDQPEALAALLEAFL